MQSILFLKPLLVQTSAEKPVLERIFGLDFQLVHDLLWTALAIFILFFALSYLLFNPAREMLEKRKKKIADELKDAEEHLAEAERMRTEYDERLSRVYDEAESILDDSRHKAMISQNEIINEAKEDAVRIRRRALQEIELEKDHARDQVKKEMVTLASQLAGKVVGREMTSEIQDEMIEETLRDISEETWQDQ